MQQVQNVDAAVLTCKNTTLALSLWARPQPYTPYTPAIVIVNTLRLLCSFDLLSRFLSYLGPRRAYGEVFVCFGKLRLRSFR